ncbi:MAG: ADP-ribosylglycohydrolase family protein [Pseudomonadota bacterium]
MKSRHELVERAVGCLLGLACGDAVARPLAGLRGAEVTRRYGEVRGPVDVCADENEPQRVAHRGMHGAHTTLALCVLDSLLYGPGGPSAPDLARRLTALSFPRNRLLPWGVLRGASSSLVRAVDAHARGEDWRLAGVREPDGAALLAVVPLGLLVGDPLEDVIDLAVDMTLVVYREPRSVALAAAMVGMQRHVVENRSFSSKGLATAALAASDLACRALASRHAGVVAGSPDAAAQALSLAIGRSEADPCPADVDCRDAPDLILASLLGSAAGENTNLIDALATLCRRGGSVDILAPALCALIGAKTGAEHLPLGLVDSLLGHREIEARARALVGPRPPALDPLYDLEVALAEKEGLWREGRPPPPPAPRRSQLNLL